MIKRLAANLLHKELSYRVHGAAIEVRKDFGPGHKEKLYQEAFAQALRRREIPFEKEKAIKIYSPRDGKYIGLYRPDFIIDGKIIVETKAEKFVSRDEIKRIYDYLRNSKYELAYFVNFASSQLFVKRIIYTNDRKPFLKLFLVSISFILVFLSGLHVHGATFEFSSLSGTPAVGAPFEASLYLDTEYERINAVQGDVLLPDALALEEIRDGNSIVSLWVEAPHVVSPGVIAFSGIIPGGYNGVKGRLFSIVVRGVAEGGTAIRLRDEQALLHDGLGTQAKTSVRDFSFAVSAGAGNAAALLPQNDTVPPEPFTPAVARDPSLFGGQWFLAFATEDKGAGIGHYEVQEGNDPFTVAKSPYLLKYQDLDRNISVKAVDKAGNSRIAVLPPPRPEPWYKGGAVWIILIGAPLFLLIRMRRNRLTRE